MTERQTVLFYCQHALGLGHLVRSLSLAEALGQQFDVVLLNGGRLPENTTLPNGVRIVNLPPLGHDSSFNLVCHDPAWTVEAAMRERPRIILDELAITEPAVVLIELYPFGRKKFEFELLPLLEAVHSMGVERPRVVCSVRDILVGHRADQARHDERAAGLVNRFFDAILVHSDPQFARLEATFHPTSPVTVPIHYTGFVTNSAAQIKVAPAERLHRVLISAGGGMVGAPLFHVAAKAHRRWYETSGMTTTVLAGPFAPAPVWSWLQDQAAHLEGFEAVRYLPDLRTEMARSAVTVSQCGYNTTMDILRAGVPAVVIPYAEGGEDEQSQRGERLDRLGVLRCLSPEGLDADRLAEAVIAIATTTPSRVTLDLDGRNASARIIAGICATPLATVPV
ncbi:MAG: glycosyltransferase [Ilumatobacteraceae bacterium]